MDINLQNKIAGMEFKNPVMAASGTFGYGQLFENFYPVSLLGGFVTKGLSLLPKEGNKTPRVCETAGGMLNAIGLQNVGIEKFIDDMAPALAKKDVTVIANFFGDTVEQFAQVAARLNETEGVDGLEMNISCPNRNENGVIFGDNIKTTAQVTRACRQATKKPLLVKLSPNVGDIAEFAKACEDNGADGLSVINTISGMAIDIRARKPVLANVMGGLSGPAIKPVAIRMVWRCYEAVKIPIFGIGGIASAEDIAEFVLAGASAVQVGSMNFVEPDICRKLVETLPGLIASLGASDYRELIGAAHD